MNDITGRDDIQHLVTRFYATVINDPVIGHFFTEVAHFSWEEHIPVMVSFWETILFPPGTFTGNPMTKHIALNKISPLQPPHFEHWLSLWKATVTELFTGDVATMAITRATSIAGVMQHKIATQ